MVRLSWTGVTDEAIGDPYELPSQRAYAETCGQANETRGRVLAESEPGDLGRVS
jgi:hypothetical protein